MFAELPGLGNPAVSSPLAAVNALSGIWLLWTLWAALRRKRTGRNCALALTENSGCSGDLNPHYNRLDTATRG